MDADDGNDYARRHIKLHRKIYFFFCLLLLEFVAAQIDHESELFIRRTPKPMFSAGKRIMLPLEVTSWARQGKSEQSEQEVRK